MKIHNKLFLTRNSNGILTLFKYQLKTTKVLDAVEVNGPNHPQRSVPKWFDESHKVGFPKNLFVLEMERKDNVPHAVADVEEDGVHSGLHEWSPIPPLFNVNNKVDEN